MRMQFAEGEVLFREGDASETVYRIDSGSVAVLKDHEGEPLLLGHVGAGEYLGEMGVVEGLPRSATAKAETAVEADILGKAEFLELVSSTGSLAFDLICRLSARLRDVSERLADQSPTEAAAPGPAAPQPAKPADLARTPVIRGGTFALQMFIGTDPLTVDKMPYTIGRVGDDAAGGAVEPDLGILDPQPYRLSPTHFTLFQDYRKIFLRDCNSELGTVVNGRTLGRDFPVDQVALDPGENVVIAGGAGSPYKFLIEV